jgi:hypothetical protein
MAATAGRVPLRIRIGVTGHRTLEDEDSIAEQVGVVLDRIQRLLPSTETTLVLYEVVSALGEGADRIVAECVLKTPSATLEVPLPLPREDYERDFGSEGSRQRFNRLLDRADQIRVVGGSDRLDAYRRAGNYVVDSCDLLIAIWDGEPSRGTGGTKEILERARRREMPTFVIDARAPFGIRERPPSSLLLLEEVGRYNRVEIPLVPTDVQRPLGPPHLEPGGGEGEALGRCLSWIEPSFHRADALASRYRFRFVAASRLIFVLSALAIASVAVSVVTAEGVGSGFAFLEALLMVGALILWLSVRRRLHRLWITSRFLAERFRSAAFLAFLGSDVVIPSVGDYRASAHEWLARVYREVWRSRPRLEHSMRELGYVKELLWQNWVGPEITYYEMSAASHATALQLTTIASVVFFVATIAAAMLHASDLATGGLERVVVALSVALPAFAAALIGISGLEQHERHAERYRLMARHLGELSDELRQASDVENIRDIASRLEAELRTESDAWIDIMRFLDVELPF